MDSPDQQLAAKIVVRALGILPTVIRRFTTGSQHYVFEAEFEGAASVVVRIARASGRKAMAGAAELSALLRPLGVPLPAILAQDLDAEFPWLLLERLPGTDLGRAMPGLSDEALSHIAAHVASAQAITAGAGSVGRYGYAVRPEEAPYSTWSEVLVASICRSRSHIRSAGLFDSQLADELEQAVHAARSGLDRVAATPFLHDTTTRNVIVTADGGFSGIVDVDDLCYGDSRYPAALTLAVLLAYGGPQQYVSAWLTHAGQVDDALFRLYVTVFLLDLMAEHGQAFNGNEQPSRPQARAQLLHAFQESLKNAREH